MKENNSEFGKRLKELMIKNGYTQKQLAIRCGCTDSAISRYISEDTK